MEASPQKLTSQDDWQSKGYSQPPTRAESEFQKYFDRHLEQRDDWSVLEVGACPGTHLLALALSHRYHPVALDYLPAVQELPEHFAKFGVPDLEVIEHDFLTLETARRFNVVMSYGFIEHFDNPEDIIRRHWDLVADDGILILNAPVFGPMQMALRRLVLEPDKLKWTLQAHNQAIMNVDAIRDICLKLPGARIEKASYVGHMGSWLTPGNRDVRRSRAWLTMLWYAAGKIPRWLNWSSWQFSPLCLVIVRRTPSS